MKLNPIGQWSRLVDALAGESAQEAPTAPTAVAGWGELQWSDARGAQRFGLVAAPVALGRQSRSLTADIVVQPAGPSDPARFLSARSLVFAPRADGTAAVLTCIGRNPWRREGGAGLLFSEGQSIETLSGGDFSVSPAGHGGVSFVVRLDLRFVLTVAWVRGEVRRETRILATPSRLALGGGYFLVVDASAAPTLPLPFRVEHSGGVSGLASELRHSRGTFRVADFVLDLETQ